MGSNILFYKFDEDLVDFLLKNDNLYNWLNPDFPEDIAFFKDGCCCWLYSVAHEEMCVIYCSDKKEYEEMKNTEIKFYKKKFKPIPKKMFYFERY